MKNLKQSTKQRFGGLDFNYPAHDVETEIVSHESKVTAEVAGKLVSIDECARNLKGHGLDEGISTRMLIYAGNLISKSVEAKAACRIALVSPIQMILTCAMRWTLLSRPSSNHGMKVRTITQPSNRK